MTEENMISQKLRTLLAEKNMRASNLAKETGIAQSTLSKITSGKSRNIQFDTIEKICIGSDIQPSELFAKCKKYETENIK